MGATITEKILSRASGRALRAGDEARVRPDFVLAYASTSYSDIYLKLLKRDFGIERLCDPERFAIFLDHNIPNTTDKIENLHVATRAWCTEQGVPYFERRGIGHLVAAEQGYAVPGAFVVHFDGHVAQLGSFGALALGIRYNILEAFVRPDIPVRVPRSSSLVLTGRLQPGVMARDVFHHFVGRFGSDACRGTILELGGEGIASLSLSDLQCITGLAMFTGAIGAIVNPGPQALAYAQPRARLQLAPVYSDLDAQYTGHFEVALDAVEPVVVAPPSPANTRPLAEHAGMALDLGYIGSCASGRIEDLRAAAHILRGRQVAPGFQLNVVPSSNEIMLQATDEGLLSELVRAGAYVSSPTCSFCYGALGGMLPGQRAISTGTLNVRGRMGSPDAEIFLASAATVAASALEGRLIDPRPFFTQGAV